MKNIFILTERFPFLSGESFLESEIRIAAEIGHHILLIPVLPFSENAGGVNRRDLSEIVDLDDSLATENPKERKFRKSARAAFSGRFVSELFRQIRNRKMSKDLLYRTVYYLNPGLAAADYIDKKYRTILSDNQNPAVVYAYWLTSPAIAATELKRKYPHITAVSRCHGYDCQPERFREKYIPTIAYTTRFLDGLYPVSSYSKETVSPYKKNVPIEVAWLGTDWVEIKPYVKKERFHIVSCAFVSPVKRIDLLAKAISHIEDIPVTWTHIGGGAGLEDIKKLCSDIMPKNVECIFMGNVDKAEIYRFYEENQIDLFVNTSQSEGMPVSIMEALSFGIPVLATDAGGTRDAVIDGHNGFMLPNSVADKGMAERLSAVWNMKADGYLKLREHAREMWEDRFSAEKNYRMFYRKITGERPI